MLWLTSFLSLAAGMCSAPAASAEESAPGRLRVLCYNIHHGEGTDGRIDLHRLAEVIRRAKPDVVALQEVDKRTNRTGRIDQTAVLAELTGLHGRFGKQLDYDGGEYGQAILSRFPLSEVTVKWLPGVPERERRIVAAAIIQVDDLKLTFASTHLHHNNAAIREDQARALNEVFAAEDQTVILAGDLNAVPDSKPISILKQHWNVATDGPGHLPTYPAVQPERQLDYVLFRPGNRLRVCSVTVIEEPLASDHRPLLVELQYDVRP